MKASFTEQFQEFSQCLQTRSERENRDILIDIYEIDFRLSLNDFLNALFLAKTREWQQKETVG